MFTAIREPHSLRVRMGAGFDNVELAVRRAKVLIDDLGLGEHTFELLLLMREALTNAVIHGCGRNSAKSIDFAFLFDGDKIIISVEDEGEGFRWREKNFTAPPPEVSKGRGLPIIKQYASSFEFNEKGNRIVLTKECRRNPMSEVKRDGVNAVIKPGRDIVFSMAEELKQELKSLVDQGAVSLTMDFQGVEMIDSIGIGLLVAAHNTLAESGGSLTLVNTSDDIARLFKSMRLDKHFLLSSS